MSLPTVTFLLPGRARNPIGGYKVVYEYANRLAKDGFHVQIVYPMNSGNGTGRWFKYLRNRISGRYRCTWFALDSRIREKWVVNLTERFVPKSAIYIATAVETAPQLAVYRRIGNDRKFYFIQHFEDWGALSREEVLASYRLPLRKIVIARWLQKLAASVGEQAVVIPNGFDFNYFSKTIPTEARDKFTVAMLWHKTPWKGAQDGLCALQRVHEKYPQLQALLFGVTPPPELPGWCRYFQRPDCVTHNRIYNEAALFLAPSHSEGWGLTLGEAMICGAAVVCTDNGGHMEMARDGENALVVPAGDISGMAEQLIRLIEDDALRRRIAENGEHDIRRFTWEASYEKFKAELMKQ